MEDDPNDGAKRENLSFRLCQGQSLEDAIKFVSHLKTEAMDMMCCKIGQPGCSSEGKLPSVQYILHVWWLPCISCEFMAYD